MTPTVRTGLGLALLVLVVFANTLSGGFQYDDFHSLVDNPGVRSLSWSIFSDPTAFSVDADKAMYRPMVLASYALQYAVHGYQTTAYHVVNVMLHLGCVLLLWRLAGRLGWGPRAAAVSAALFAVHPVVSEPVNYVSSRSESLAALFVLAALWTWLRSSRERRFLWLSLPLFAAGLMSKATAAALPLLQLCFLWLRGPADGMAATVRRLLPFGVVLLAHVALLSRLALLPADREHAVRSLADQLATQLKAVPWYLHLFGMPVRQSVDPAFTEGTWGSAAVWVAVALLASVGALMLLVARGDVGRWRWWLLWPFVVSLPASAVPLNVLVNEHRIYLAAAGLCIPVAVLLCRCRLRGIGAPGVIVIGVLAILTVERNGVWETPRSLWSDAVARGPHAARARVHLGNALRTDGDLRGAARQFEHAVLLEPGNLAARTNLGNTQYELAAATEPPSVTALQSAADQYGHVLAAEPDHREALTNLGNVLRLAGDPEGARRAYQQAIKVHLRHPDAYANLAELEIESGNFSSAVTLLQQVVGLEPDVATGFHRLGDAQVMAGKLVEAGRAYASACRLDPGDAGACYNLAEILRARGERLVAAGSLEDGHRLWGDAVAAYERVLSRFGEYRQAREQRAALLELLWEGRPQ